MLWTVVVQDHVTVQVHQYCAFAWLPVDFLHVFSPLVGFVEIYVLPVVLCRNHASCLSTAVLLLFNIKRYVPSSSFKDFRYVPSSSPDFGQTLSLSDELPSLVACRYMPGCPFFHLQSIFLPLFGWSADARILVHRVIRWSLTWSIYAFCVPVTPAEKPGGAYQRSTIFHVHA